MMCFFSQKAATLKTPENQTNDKPLQNTKNIKSKESQNKTLQDASATKKKKARRINLLARPTRKMGRHLRRPTRTWQS